MSRIIFWMCFSDTDTVTKNFVQSLQDDHKSEAIMIRKLAEMMENQTAMIMKLTEMTENLKSQVLDLQTKKTGIDKGTSTTEK